MLLRKGTFDGRIATVRGYAEPWRGAARHAAEKKRLTFSQKILRRVEGAMGVEGVRLHLGQIGQEDISQLQPRAGPNREDGVVSQDSRWY